MRLPGLAWAGVAAALLAAGVSAAAPGEEALAWVPGTGVQLRVPEGFTQADTFAGIVHEGSGASVLVSEMSAPVEETRKSLQPERLAAGGIRVHETSPVSVGDVNGTLVYGTQLSDGAPYRKWLLVFGNAEKTVSVIATVPTAHEESVRDAVLGVLSSVHWDPERVIDPFEGLGFRIRETPSLRVADRMANMLFLTRPGAAVPAPPGEPLYIVGTSRRPDAAAGLRDLARSALEGITEVTSLAVQSEEALTLGGHEGVETVAEGVDTGTGDRVVVYQALLEGGADRIFLMQGLVGGDRAERYLPEFRALTRSFESAP